MKLRELLELGIIHDNVRLVIEGDDSDFDYQYKATKVFRRAPNLVDFKPNNLDLRDFSQKSLDDLLEREVCSVTGAKQKYVTLIFLERKKELHCLY